MGMWNTHGMDEDNENLLDAISILGMTPEELVELSDYAEKQSWIMTQLGRQERGQQKRKCNLIAKHWQRRARKWKELAAAWEAEVAEQFEDAEPEEVSSEG
jgi:hypothetical protein